MSIDGRRNWPTYLIFPPVFFFAIMPFSSKVGTPAQVPALRMDAIFFAIRHHRLQPSSSSSSFHLFCRNTVYFLSGIQCCRNFGKTYTSTNLPATDWNVGKCSTEQAYNTSSSSNRARAGMNSGVYVNVRIWYRRVRTTSPCYVSRRLYGIFFFHRRSRSCACFDVFIFSLMDVDRRSS